MSGHIFLHIGPPKTATTSLQLGLQGIKLSGLCYLGVFQPRSESANSDSRILIRVCRADPTVAEDSQQLRASLEARVSRGETVIISEEMFVVGSGDETIKAQLRRLVAYFDGLPTTVIVTLRDPRDAVPSYFQEIYRSLPFEIARDFSRFAEDGRTFCYDYSALCSFIESLGVDIHLLDFRLLASDEVTLAGVLGASCSIDAPLHLAKANVGSVSKDGDKRTLPGVDLSRLASTRSLKMFIDYLGLRRFPGWKAAGRIARRISIKRKRQVALRLNEATERRFLLSFEDARRRWNPKISALPMDKER